jgi:hypothetical protein
MKLSEIDNKFKIFEIKIVSGDSYFLDGEKLQMVLKSPQDYFVFPNGEGFRKTSISNWILSIDKTRENVFKNKDKLAINKSV